VLGGQPRATGGGQPQVGYQNVGDAVIWMRPDPPIFVGLRAGLPLCRRPGWRHPDQGGRHPTSRDVAGHRRNTSRGPAPSSGRQGRICARTEARCLQAVRSLGGDASGMVDIIRTEERQPAGGCPGG